MSLWKAVLAFLAPKARSARRTWDPITNPFDADRVAKQLRLEEQGRELGQSGVPLTSDTWPSGPEANAVLAVAQAQADYVVSYQHRLKVLQAQASRSDLTAKLVEALASAEQFERQADNLLTENATQLQRFADLARSRREALERFREQHQRIELPHYPTQGKKTFLYVVAAALILVETGFNASFFAQGLGGGLLEGLVEAFGFSLFNVGGAFTVGAFVVRLKNHVKAAMRLLGYTLAAFALSGLACLALMVSHYRDALHMGTENAGKMTMQTLLSTPFDLAGPSSWILFGVSCFAACFAMWEGYSINDPYPRYGAVHHRAEVAAKTYERAVQALRNELARFRQTLITRMDKIQEACEASIVGLRGVIADKERLDDEMRNEIQSLEKALVALVETFRTGNKVGRQGNSDPPAYFQIKPQLDKRSLPDFSTHEDEALLKQQEESTADLVRNKETLCARIESAFNDRYSSLRTVNDLFDPGRQPLESHAENQSTPAVGEAAPAKVVSLRSASADGGVGA
jgi:predicted phage tail protein